MHIGRHKVKVFLDRILLVFHPGTQASNPRTIRWYKDGQLIPMRQPGLYYNNVESGNLTIQRVDESVAGVYRCDMISSDYYRNEDERLRDNLTYVVTVYSQGND